jgi:hypothetical protein
LTISYGATNKGIAEQIKNAHFKPVDPVKGKKLTRLPLWRSSEAGTCFNN